MRRGWRFLKDKTIIALIALTVKIIYLTDTLTWRVGGVGVFDGVASQVEMTFNQQTYFVGILFNCLKCVIFCFPFSAILWVGERCKFSLWELEHKLH